MKCVSDQLQGAIEAICINFISVPKFTENLNLLQVLYHRICKFVISCPSPRDLTADLILCCFVVLEVGGEHHHQVGVIF